ncbi:MAG: cytochrome c [Rhodospirillaceae bacterium]|jgi:cytochrome c556|nr:cytochrome c [Rhodospirillaceae bacterium]MBT3930611.1 cytochrome c [Rhodospirillaceae bacterium]MBT4771585.1 cytochrome c [Rhodospirillaceae bacterium]MBT5357827.1 cytochrome c [Rhodospirillaceae bacterium]MBT5770134.1 cytochrome c [Rhodospirillaceae bacterium]
MHKTAKRNVGYLIGGTLAIMAATSLAHAHGGATGIVKERMDLMASVGKSMKTITEMFQGTKPYDAEQVRAAARFIGTHGGEQTTKLFPEGSINGPSEALPAIWQDWDKFSKLADDLSVYARALADAADNPRGAGMGAARRGGGLSSGGSPMGRSNPMMGSASGSPMNDPAVLATMAPNAAFARLTQTCSACHTQFRKKQ